MKPSSALFLGIVLGAALGLTSYQCFFKKGRPLHSLISKEAIKLPSQKNLAKKADHITQNHSFVIIVPSYNNAKYCARNIESILMQDYPFYRVIYFDDASEDATFDIVKNLVEASGHKEKFELIQNKKNMGAVSNIYRGCHACRNEEIVVILDGDDRLATDFVLSSLNAYYNNPDIWLTYGQCVEYPSSTLGPSVPIAIQDLINPKIRKMTWRTSHLRTFYAGLYKKIKMEDLQYNGAFLDASGDLAIMFPMIEMAREHAVFTPDIFCIYNNENPLSDQKVKREKQLLYDRYIRNKPIYNKLHRQDIL
jgi:glycosyltransferase involved in cell wall biosynthesis